MNLTIIDEWAIWNRSVYTYQDVLEFMNASYKLGMRKGIIIGLIISLIIFIIFKFVNHAKSETKQNGGKNNG